MLACAPVKAMQQEPIQYQRRLLLCYNRFWMARLTSTILSSALPTIAAAKINGITKAQPMEVAMWVLIVTAVTLNGSLYVAVPFDSLPACQKAGQGRVAAIYHPATAAGKEGDAYEVKDTFFQCERREALKQQSRN